MADEAPGFPVLDVSSWRVTSLETAGSDEKLWIASESGQRALFKPNRDHLEAAQGEDWAEKLVSEIAALLGVPAARIDLANRNGVRGCISYTVKRDDYELQPGAALIGELVGPSFDPHSRDAWGHTLENIAAVLPPYRVPPEFDGPQEIGGYGVFAGYMILDALVANRDRHSENWSVLRSQSHAVSDALAPSYDHASSLGFNLRDARRSQLLRDRKMFEAFLRKGDAHRFERGRHKALVDHALQALSIAGDRARDFWLARLAALDPAELQLLAARTTTMSDLARTLAIEILKENRRRLLDD